MATQAQIEANRLNAQKSTGPKTPEGKAHVALNALKHGIRAKALVASLQCNPLFDDDPQAFADLVQGLVDHFHPEGPIEEACVEDIAICQWRLRRIICAETGHIASAQAILLSGPGADNPRLRARNGLPYFEDLEKLNRYEISIQRQLQRSLSSLTALIRERGSNAGQSSSGSTSKQKPDRDGDVAAIRREVLGYLMAEFGPTDPASVALPEEAPTKSALATVAENNNPRKQTQSSPSGPDAGLEHPRTVSPEQIQSPANRPDAVASTLGGPSFRRRIGIPRRAVHTNVYVGESDLVGQRPATLQQSNPHKQTQSPEAVPEPRPDSLSSTSCVGEGASPPGVRPGRTAPRPGFEPARLPLAEDS